MNEALPTKITEDEAALYDRQIRLWGMEAQERMRNASLLLVNLKGLAAETAKNIVLSGVGRITLFDSGAVTEEDLGCGFLFKEDDIGKKRVDAAKPNVEALNPLVKVETISNPDMISDLNLPQILRAVDLVCLTDATQDEINRFSNGCRTHNVLFYAAGTYGILGYIFADLLRHRHLSTVRAKTAAQENTQEENQFIYPSFQDAISSVSATFQGMSRRLVKEANAPAFFSILGLWEYQSLHNGMLPGVDEAAITKFQNLVNDRVKSCQAPNLGSVSFSTPAARSLVQMAPHEFSPTCAVVGGLLAQDILKALSRQEPPYANFLIFDGAVGSGNVIALKVQKA